MIVPGCVLILRMVIIAVHMDASSATFIAGKNLITKFAFSVGVGNWRRRMDDKWKEMLTNALKGIDLWTYFRNNLCENDKIIIIIIFFYSFPYFPIKVVLKLF